MTLNVANLPPANLAQAAPADSATLLELLRDIQLPAAVSWWPPAPGWWLLLGVALLAWLIWRYEWYAGWRRSARATPALSAPAAALEELARARAAFAGNGDAGALVASLSVLLRRVAMGVASRGEAAALTGEPWLKWLDAQVEGEAFSAGPGRVLADAPYRAAADVAAEVDGDALLRVCEEWIVAISGSLPEAGLDAPSRGGAA